MFDQVPASVWLLIAIAAVAYSPALYIFQHIAAAPARRDITQPSVDLSWRTSTAFIRSLSILAALAGLALFIFTPAAERIAQSPSFFPIVMASIGAWALYTVPRALVTGQVQPFAKGFHDTFTREVQPKRFWVSLAWNALLGCLLLGLAYPFYKDARWQPLKDRCFDEEMINSPQERLAACNELVSSPSMSPDEMTSFIGARGDAYSHLGDYRLALTDYDETIRRDPRDPHAYLNRGLIFLDTAKFDQALADFTKAHELDPKDAWPLANRGITHASKNNRERAEADFKAVRAVEPANPVLLRGEGLLALNAGEMKLAVDRLTASLVAEPDNPWALAKRAEAYTQLGEHEKARADIDKLQRLPGMQGS